MREVERKILIPLFNTVVNQHCELSFNLPASIKPLAFHFIEKPLEPIFLKDAKFQILISPMRKAGELNPRILDIFPVQELEDGFDMFSIHRADTALVFCFQEFYPETQGVEILVEGAQSAYDHDLVSSFMLALKLHDDNEPHYHRGFYTNNGLLQKGFSIYWPTKTMQGKKMVITQPILEDLFKNTEIIWSLDRNSSESSAVRILSLASSYYMLSSTQAEYNVIFILLMIAFEAMFKRKDEESVSRARSRMGKLISNSKRENSAISDFLNEDPKIGGCCFKRNALIHGDEKFGGIASEVFWQLKSLIRRSITSLCQGIASGEIDIHSYYESLDVYVEKRFAGLPTSS